MTIPYSTDDSILSGAKALQSWSHFLKSSFCDSIINTNIKTVFEDLPSLQKALGSSPTLHNQELWNMPVIQSEGGGSRFRSSRLFLASTRE